MTPREIERTLEFIVEQQAQTAVHLQDAAVHIQRLADRHGKMQSMMELMTELAEVQSQRLDRHDETFRSVAGNASECGWVSSIHAVVAKGGSLTVGPDSGEADARSLARLRVISWPPEYLVFRVILQGHFDLAVLAIERQRRIESDLILIVHLS